MKISLSYPHINKRILDVSIQLHCTKNQAFTLQMPVWRPGRYELANFAQYIYPFSSENAGITKISKDCWEIMPLQDVVSIHYQFYANQPDAGGSFLTDEFIYLNPINFIPQASHYASVCELELNCPSDYVVATSLTISDKKVLQAKNYEELIDSPIIASASIQHRSYTLHNTNFHIWIQGNVLPEWEKIVNDFQKFTQEQIRIFGAFPSENYHFLNIIHPFSHYHGVEHANSTVIVLGPDSEFNSSSSYLDFLGISSHELFHFWNIKRIKPQELIPLDVSKEVYFNTGYVAEGLTTYYGDYMLMRSGVFTQEMYFNEINTYLKRHFFNNGRHVNNLTNSSLELWLDGYKAGTPSRKVSIYIKGALVSLILDLKIRALHNHQHSLDSVMQVLWQMYGNGEKGYTLSSFKEIVAKFIPDQTLIEKLIEGTGDLEPFLKEAFNFVGCELTYSRNANNLMADYGIFLNPATNEIHQLHPQAPAYQTLCIGDQIVAVNGKKYNHSENSNFHNLEIEIKRYGKTHVFTFQKTKNHYFQEPQITQTITTGLAHEHFKKWLYCMFAKASTAYCQC